MLDNNLYLVDIQYQLALLQKEYNLPEEIRVMCDYDPIGMFYRVYISAPHIGVEISDSTKEINEAFANKLVETVRLLLKGGENNGRKNS